MVTKERKWMPVKMVSEILNGTAKPKEQVEKLKEEINNLPNPRQPKEPTPEGGISIRAGGRKYDIYSPTISRWVEKGLIPVLLRTKNEVYIDEFVLSQLAKRYKQDPGRGKRTI